MRASTEQRPGGRQRRRWATLVALLLAVALVGSACSAPRRLTGGIADAITDTAFYDLPSTVAPGAPGALIRVQRLLGAPDGSVAWRVIYHSRDVTGADVPVSAVVVAPTGWTPKGGRAVVAWGHPTTGMVARCGPSLGVYPWLLIEGLQDMLKAGYVVVATDYPGMGVAGRPSYLVGESEGHSVLDAVRAARSITDTGANNQVLLWGHSQGGQAVLFAGEEARSYAPELHVLAVAVAAPATQLADLLRDDISDDSGVTLGAWAFATYAQVYGPTTPGTELTTVLTPAGAAALPSMEPMCLLRDNSALHAIAGPLVGHFLSNDPGTTKPWSTLLAQNTPGNQPLGIPLFVGQGTADVLVKPPTTDTYVAKLCAAGEHVDYQKFPGVGHGGAADAALPDVVHWFALAVAGQPMLDNCPA